MNKVRKFPNPEVQATGAAELANWAPASKTHDCVIVTNWLLRCEQKCGLQSGAVYIWTKNEMLPTPRSAVYNREITVICCTWWWYWTNLTLQLVPLLWLILYWLSKPSVFLCSLEFVEPCKLIAFSSWYLSGQVLMNGALRSEAKPLILNGCSGMCSSPLAMSRKTLYS